MDKTTRAKRGLLLATAFCLSVVTWQVHGAASGDPDLLPFDAVRGSLITNEYAHWNPDDPARVESSVWEVTSGSLFSHRGHAWSGEPDAVLPDRESKNGNGSSVFRLTTRRADYTDVALTFSILNDGLTVTPRTPAADWDGIHLLLRYQSEESLYYASLNRRDDTVTIKKKVPGGVSNGGTYYDLSSSAPHHVPYGTWQHVRATVTNQPDGTVRIVVEVDGRLAVEGVDAGDHGTPLVGPGKVGVRGDNCNFMLDDFRAAPIVGKTV